jgi:hypothetical protein
MSLGQPQGADWTGVSLKLVARTFLGSRCLLHGAVGGNDRAIIELPADAVGRVVPGDMIDITWQIADTLLYPAVSR